MTVTVVTGGDYGIGAALCRQLAAPGALEALASELAALGAETCVAVQSLAHPSRAGAVIDAMQEPAGFAVSMSFQHMG